MSFFFAAVVVYMFDLLKKLNKAYKTSTIGIVITAVRSHGLGEKQFEFAALTQSQSQAVL